jgi:hypothetical protein
MSKRPPIGSRRYPDHRKITLDKSLYRDPLEDAPSYSMPRPEDVVPRDRDITPITTAKDQTRRASLELTNEDERHERARQRDRRAVGKMTLRDSLVNWFNNKVLPPYNPDRREFLGTAGKAVAVGVGIVATGGIIKFAADNGVFIEDPVKYKEFQDKKQRERWDKLNQEAMEKCPPDHYVALAGSEVYKRYAKYYYFHETPDGYEPGRDALGQYSTDIVGTLDKPITFSSKDALQMYDKVLKEDLEDDGIINGAPTGTIRTPEDFVEIPTDAYEIIGKTKEELFRGAHDYNLLSTILGGKLNEIPEHIYIFEPYIPPEPSDSE